MKRMIYILLTAALLLSLGACKKGKDKNAPTTDVLSAEQAGQSLNSLSTFLVQIFQANDSPRIDQVLLSRQQVSRLRDEFPTMEQYKSLDPQMRKQIAEVLSVAADSTTYARMKAVCEASFVSLNEDSHGHRKIDWSQAKIESFDRLVDVTNPLLSTLRIHLTVNNVMHTLEINHVVQFDGKWWLLNPNRVLLDSSANLPNR